MNDTLVSRDGWLYIHHIESNWSKPEQYHLYWPLGIRFMDWAHRFRSTEEAEQALGAQVRYLGNGCYEGPLGLTYRMKDGAQTKSEFHSVEQIPAPKIRGKQLEVRWYEGRWQKYLQSKGWVTA